MTYRELNERANRMAHQLRSDVNPNPNEVIALVMDKSEHMIVSTSGRMEERRCLCPH